MLFECAQKHTRHLEDTITLMKNKKKEEKYSNSLALAFTNWDPVFSLLWAAHYICFTQLCTCFYTYVPGSMAGTEKLVHNLNDSFKTLKPSSSLWLPAWEPSDRYSSGELFFLQFGLARGLFKISSNISISHMQCSNTTLSLMALLLKSP